MSLRQSFFPASNSARAPEWKAPDAGKLRLDSVVGLGIDRHLRLVAVLVQLGLALLVHLGLALLRLLLHVCKHHNHSLPIMLHVCKAQHPPCVSAAACLQTQQP